MQHTCPRQIPQQEEEDQIHKNAYLLFYSGYIDYYYIFIGTFIIHTVFLHNKGHTDKVWAIDGIHK